MPGLPFAEKPHMVPVQTSHPLKLATRMQRLGTETAFVVFARARALEAQGRDIVHLEIGLADLEVHDVSPLSFECAGAREYFECRLRPKPLHARGQLQGMRSLNGNHVRFFGKRQTGHYSPDAPVQLSTEKRQRPRQLQLLERWDSEGIR